MRFIELHLENGGVEVMINLDTVAYILPGDDVTVICFAFGEKDEADTLEVRESYSVVRGRLIEAEANR